MIRHTLVALSISLWPLALIAGDWPHWRGPSRDGLTTEASGFEDGKWHVGKPLWSANVGEGSTSPLLVGDHVFTIGHRDDKDHVVCLDAATGKEVWKRSHAARRFGRHALGDQGMYGGPTPTPEYDPKTRLLYTLGNDGDLICHDAADKGARKWSINLYDEYRMPRRPKVGKGGLQRDYGYTSSPLLYGDWLLVEVGGKDGLVVAFDKKTGKKVWGSQNKDLAGHTGGMALLSVEGVPCLAVLTLHNLVVMRLDKGREGETVGVFPWATEFANNVASPVAAGDCVLVTSAYNQKAICKVQVTLSGLKSVWRQPYPSKACTPVVHKGHVYFAWQRVQCLDLKTGKLVWEGGHVGDPGSCLITSDERLIVWGQNGRLILAETAARSPKEYTELDRRDRVFSAHAWPHVALGGGRLCSKDRLGNVKVFAVGKGKK
jgi:outer membrane protein assembly factor BamB